jgi:DNA-binding transcriptional regulator LsrR (DeoR family)
VTDASDLPDDVRALLHGHIESYEQLETLLLLRREHHEAWTTEGLAARLHVRAELVERALARLKASGLVEATGTAPTRFAYRPTSSGLDAAAGRLEREYAERPILIIQLMSANALGRLRTAALHTFADAFVLKKDKKDG